MSLTRRGQPIPLTPLPSRILLKLIEGRNQPYVAKEMLQALKPGGSMTDTALHQHMHVLRDVFRCVDGRDEEFIRTVSGFGYRFTAVVEEKVPDLSIAQPPIFGRDDETKALCSSIEPGIVVPVIGLPNSGKSYLVSATLKDPYFAAARKRLEISSRRLRILQPNVPLTAGSHPLLRGLAKELNMNKREDFDFTSDPTRVDSLSREIIFDGLRGCAALLVLEGWEMAEPSASLDLSSLWQNLTDSATLAAIITSTVPVPSIGTITPEPAIELGPVSTTAAKQILATIIPQDESLLDSTVSALASDDPSILLLPGVLVDGAKRYQRGLSRSKVEGGVDVLVGAIYEIAMEAVREVLAFWECGDLRLSNGRPGPFATILALAVFGGGPLPRSILEAANLPIEPLEPLQRIGWVGPEAESVSLQAALVRLAPISAASYLGAVGSSESAFLEDAILSLVGLIGDQITALEGEHDVSAVVEFAWVWLRRRQLGTQRLHDALLEILAPLGVDDWIPPFTEDDASAFRSRATDGDPSEAHSLTNVVFAARYAHSAEDFLEALSTAIDDLVTEIDIRPEKVKSLNKAAFVGERRFRCFREVLELRSRLIQPLRSQLSSGATRALCVSAIDWLLATADLMLDAGQRSAAKEIFDVVDVHQSVLPPPTRPVDEIRSLELNARRCELASRICDQAETKTAAAFEYFEVALRLFKKSLAPKNYWRAVNALTEYVDAERSEDKRRTAVVGFSKFITSTYGTINSEWPTFIATGMAKIYRTFALQSSDRKNALTYLSSALELLDEDEAVMPEGDPNILIERAFCFRAMSEIDSEDRIQHLRKASSTHDAILKARKSSRAFLSALRDDDMLGQTEEPDLVATRAISSRLQRRIGDAEKWLGGIQSPGLDDAFLTIWVMRRRWQSEGSLERFVSTCHKSSWQGLSKKEKWRRIQSEYRKRRAIIEDIKARCPPTEDIVVADAILENQIQRQRAFYMKITDFSRETVEQIYELGRSKLPNSYRLCLEHANYKKRCWDFLGAAELYNHVIATCPRAKLRRDAHLSLVDNLIRRATYGTLSDDRQSILGQARELLSNVDDFVDVESEVSKFRLRLRLESGEPFPWAEVEKLAVAATDVESDSTRQLAFHQITDPDLLMVVNSLVDNADLVDVIGGLLLRGAEISSGDDALDRTILAHSCLELRARLLGETKLQNHTVLGFQVAHTIVIASRCKLEKGELVSAEDLQTALTILSEISKRTVGGYREVILKDLSFLRSTMTAVPGEEK